MVALAGAAHNSGAVVAVPLQPRPRTSCAHSDPMAMGSPELDEQRPLGPVFRGCALLALAQLAFQGDACETAPELPQRWPNRR